MCILFVNTRIFVNRNTVHHCDTMKLVHQRPSPPLPPKVDPDCYIDVEPSTYVSDLRHMLNNPLCADVEFLVESVVFHAHRVVLCASSLLFKKMFSGEEVMVLDDCGAVGHPFMAVSQRCAFLHNVCSYCVCSVTLQNLILCVLLLSH